MTFLPETPRYAYRHGRQDEAKQTMMKVYGAPENHYAIFTELEEIESKLKSELKKGNFVTEWYEMIYAPRMGYRIVLGMTLQMFQQLTGANYFFYYGATLFSSVGLVDSFVVQIILGAVNFVCTFGGIYIMERFGRRKPLIIGGIWQSCWLVVFAAAGTAKNPEGNPGIGNLMIVSACFFIAGYAMTWAPAIWILVGETFPTRSRAKQGATATAGNWLWNFLIGFFSPFIAGSIGYAYGFVFAGCNLAGALTVYLFLYESSKLSLEAVDAMYNDKGTKAWNSAKWVPAGHDSRTDFNKAIEAEQKEAARGATTAQHRELADDDDAHTLQGDHTVQEKTKKAQHV